MEGGKAFSAATILASKLKTVYSKEVTVKHGEQLPI